MIRRLLYCRKGDKREYLEERNSFPWFQSTLYYKLKSIPFLQLHLLFVVKSSELNCNPKKNLQKFSLTAPSFNAHFSLLISSMEEVIQFNQWRSLTSMVFNGF